MSETATVERFKLQARRKVQTFGGWEDGGTSSCGQDNNTEMPE